MVTAHTPIVSLFCGGGGGGGGGLSALSPSPDEQHIAVGGREVFKVVARVAVCTDDDDSAPAVELREAVNMRSGRGVNMLFTVVDLAWHPLHSAAHIVASAPTNGALCIWDVEAAAAARGKVSGRGGGGGKLMRRFTEHTRTVNRVVWQPGSGEMLLSGSQDGTARLWDIRAPGSAAGVQCFALRRGSTAAASRTTSSSSGSGSIGGGGGSVGEEVRDVQFSRHNTHLFAAGTESGGVLVWDIRRAEAPLRHMPAAHRGIVQSVSWHPDCRSVLATAGRDRTIKVWDLNTDGGSGWDAIEETGPADLSGIGSGGSSYGVDTGDTVLGLGRPYTYIQTTASVARIAWRPSPAQNLQQDSTRRYVNQIASCAALLDTGVHVWDTQRPYTPHRTLQHHRDLVTGIQWMRDGEHLLTCSKDGTLSLVHVPTAAHNPLVDMSVTALSWTPRNELASTSAIIDRDGEDAELDDGVFHEEELHEEREVLGVQHCDYDRDAEGIVRIVDVAGQNDCALNGTGGDNASGESVDEDEMCTATGSILVEDVDPDTFAHLARNYVLFEGSIEHKCRHNARVAAEAGRFQEAAVWNTVQTLFAPDPDDASPDAIADEDLSASRDLSEDGGYETDGEDSDEGAGYRSSDDGDYHVAHYDSDYGLTSDDGHYDDSEDDYGDISDAFFDGDVGDMFAEFLSMQDAPSFDVHSPQQTDDTLLHKGSSSLLNEHDDFALRPSQRQQGGHFSLDALMDTIRYTSPSTPLPTSASPSPRGGAHPLSLDSHRESGPVAVKLDSAPPGAAVSAAMAPGAAHDGSSHHNGDPGIQDGQYAPPPVFRPVRQSRRPRRGKDGDPVRAADVPVASFQPIMYEVLEHYADCGDVQMCVALAATIGDKLQLDSTTVQRWFLAYVDMLRQMKLFVQAAEVIKQSPHPVISAMSKQLTSVKTSCGTCRSNLEGVMPYCANVECRRRLRPPVCMICHLPIVESGIVWCIGCGHGGHAEHMRRYFSRHDRCPMCQSHVSQMQSLHD